MEERVRRREWEVIKVFQEFLSGAMEHADLILFYSWRDRSFSDHCCLVPFLLEEALFLEPFIS